MEETELEGFDSDAQSFYCGNVCHDQLLQITAQAVRLISAASKKLLCDWRPPTAGRNISVATCNRHQVVCAVGADLYYITIDQGGLTQVRYVLVPNMGD